MSRNEHQRAYIDLTHYIMNDIIKMTMVMAFMGKNMYLEFLFTLWNNPFTILVLLHLEKL